MEPLSFLESEEALSLFVDRWERGDLPSEAWTHAAHVATCAFYATRFDREAVFARMKAGILHFNTCVGTPNTEDRGYHETLTRFWAQTICDSIATSLKEVPIEKIRETVEKLKSSRYATDFYSFDVVKSREARRSWVPPDRT